MKPASPLRLFTGLSALFDRPPQTTGRCYHCERFTSWATRHGFYCCTRCGADPVHDRPDETRADAA